MCGVQGDGGGVGEPRRGRCESMTGLAAGHGKTVLDGDVLKDLLGGPLCQNAIDSIKY